MRYAVEGDDLCIRISLDAIAEQAFDKSLATVLDKSALATALGRELCDCENAGGEPYINAPLDAALERVIESGDPSLDFNN